MPQVILTVQSTFSKDFDLLIRGKGAGFRVVCTDSCTSLPGLLAGEKVLAPWFPWRGQVALREAE